MVRNKTEKIEKTHELAERVKRDKRDGAMALAAVGLAATGLKVLFAGPSTEHAPSRIDSPAHVFELRTSEAAKQREAMYAKYADAETSVAISYADGRGEQAIKTKGLPYVWNKQPGDNTSGVDPDRRFVQIELNAQQPDGSYERRMFHLPTTPDAQLTDSDGKPIDGPAQDPGLTIEVTTFDDQLRGSFTFDTNGYTEDLSDFSGK